MQSPTPGDLFQLCRYGLCGEYGSSADRPSLVNVDALQIHHLWQMWLLCRYHLWWMWLLCRYAFHVKCGCCVDMPSVVNEAAVWIPSVANVAAVQIHPPWWMWLLCGYTLSMVNVVAVWIRPPWWMWVLCSYALHSEYGCCVDMPSMVNVAAFRLSPTSFGPWELMVHLVILDSIRDGKRACCLSEYYIPEGMNHIWRETLNVFKEVLWAF